MIYSFNSKLIADIEKYQPVESTIIKKITGYIYDL